MPESPPEDAPAGQPPAKDDDDDGATRWVTATSQARETAKWTATAVAAVGGVVFGAGPLIADVEQDVAEWSVVRIVLALAAALVGVYGVLALIGALLRAQLPIELSLARLPRLLELRIRRRPEDFLPSGCTSLSQFRSRLRSYRRASLQLANDARTATVQRRPAIKAAAAAMQQNAHTYERTRDELLAEAGYLETISALEHLRRPAGKGALLAVFGAVSYLLLVSAPANDDDGKAEGVGGSDSVPELATLLPTDPQGEFWTELELASCEIGNGEVPVLLVGGSGSGDDPWELQTIGTPKSCPSITFTARSEVVQLVQREPREITINFEPREGD